MKLRMIGKQGKKKTEVFIEVIAVDYLGALIKLNIIILKEERLSLQRKTTVLEYTVKIGILLGLNLQFTLKENYKNDIYNKFKYQK